MVHAGPDGAMTSELMDCILSPNFITEHLNGDCKVLGGEFTKSDAVQIDASSCEEFLGDFPPERQANAHLKPIKYDLRKGSSDHIMVVDVRCLDYTWMMKGWNLCEKESLP